VVLGLLAAPDISMSAGIQRPTKAIATDPHLLPPLLMNTST